MNDGDRAALEVVLSELRAGIDQKVVPSEASAAAMLPALLKSFTPGAQMALACDVLSLFMSALGQALPALARGSKPQIRLSVPSSESYVHLNPQEREGRDAILNELTVIIATSASTWSVHRAKAVAVAADALASPGAELPRHRLGNELLGAMQAPLMARNTIERMRFGKKTDAPGDSQADSF